MATLEEQLRSELTASLKAKDLKTANLIRMINTKIMERRTAKSFSGTVDDALVLDVIATYKKQMEKAKQEFAAAGDRGKDQIAEIDFELGKDGPHEPRFAHIVRGGRRHPAVQVDRGGDAKNQKSAQPDCQDHLDQRKGRATAPTAGGPAHFTH